MSIPSQPHPPRRNSQPTMLNKQLSWSPETTREEIWLRRKGNSATRRRCSKSVTDDDLEELKACIELGFGFEPDSSDLDPKLSYTLPALGFYCALNKQYTSCLSRSASTPSLLSVSGKKVPSVLYCIYRVLAIGFGFYFLSDHGLCFFCRWWSGDGEEEVEAMGPVCRMLGQAIFRRTKLMSLTCRSLAE